MVAVMMANEYRIDTVPRRRTGEQRRFYFLRYTIVLTIVVAKKRIKQDLRVTSLDHYPGVRKIMCAPCFVVFAVSRNRQNRQYNQGEKSSH